MNSCIFCKIVAGQIGANIVLQDESVMAFRDVNPQAPVHILIIPKKHIEHVAALSADDASLLAALQRAIQQVAKSEKILESGFRVVTNTGKDGGQSVSHLHYHVMGGRSMSWPPG
jgi:histidine triad (HIT) family protein